MKVTEKIEVLRHTIDRYDHFYDSINNKSNLFLTLNSFLFGGIITGYYSIKDELYCDKYVVVFVWIALIFCLISLGLLLAAIIPYTNKPSKTLQNSLFNFRCVANFSKEEFMQAYDERKENDIYQDYLEQTQLLAKGLKRKFSLLEWAAYSLAAVFLSIVFIGTKIL